MSESGRQLVRNDQSRKALLKEARATIGELLAVLSVVDEEGLADLDAPRVRRLIAEIEQHKDAMRELRKTYRELQQAAASE